MAKKTTTTKRTTVERRERRDLTKICAFWGILLSGVAMFIGFIISLLQLDFFVKTIMFSNNEGASRGIWKRNSGTADLNRTPFNAICVRAAA